MDFEDDSKIDEIGADHEGFFMPQTKNTMVYALHTLLNQFELHLDNFTHKYKIMALKWLLATFAAVGFLFSVELNNPKINILVMVSIVCLFGIIGITSVWYMDLYVFHRFWGAFFVEEVKIEKRHEFLTKIRDTSLSLGNLRTRISGHENFYISFNLILIITGGISLSFLPLSGITKIALCGTVILLSLAMIKFMSKGGEKLEKILEQLLEEKK